MKKFLMICFATLSIATIMITGCGKDNIEYGKEIGTVEGKVEFKDKDKAPEIILSNIRSYVGEEIDFLSGVEIGNIDEDKDMETWVDASLVDIFTTGDYKATYTFKYDGKEYTKDIVVTIIEKENSGESNVVSNDKNQETTFIGQNNNGQQNTTNAPDGNGQQNTTNTPDGSGQQNTTNTPDGSGQQNTTNTPDGNGQQNTTNTPDGSGQQSTTKSPNGNGQQSTTKSPNGNGQQSTTKSPNGNGQQSTTKSPNSTASTTRRQIVTSFGNSTTEYKELGYYSIELLSGKTVKLKSTTSKYIVSTHTDISYVTKNDSKYKVSKLIVNFSDGTSRVLETVEEKVQ